MLSGLFTGLLSIVAAVSVTTLYHNVFAPSNIVPRVAVVDDEDLQARMAMMRIAAAKPGEPESPTLAALNAEALEKALSDAAAQSGTLIFSKRALLAAPSASSSDSPAIGERLRETFPSLADFARQVGFKGLSEPRKEEAQPSPATLDLTQDVAATLGIEKLDRGALEAAFRANWLTEETKTKPASTTVSDQRTDATTSSITRPTAPQEGAAR